MNKIEFTDVNRFLASLGLISIGLAFFLPWFINQSNTLLIIEQKKILELTPTAQLIIAKQQDTLWTVNKLLPYISIGLILLGVVLLICGIVKWKKRQAVLDKIQDEELKSKEISNLSSQEKRDLIESEIVKTEQEEDEPTIVTPNTETQRQEEIDNYIQIENSIFLQLSTNYKANYTASQNVRIADSNFDIILKSKDQTQYKDRIVEIKFFKKQLTYEQIKDAATKLIFACNQYETNFKRRTYPVLIIIYTELEFDETIKQFKNKIELYGKELVKPIKVNFFERTKIANAKAADFFK
ncbi:MAG: hypothetical protein ACYC01_02235 [Lutibacter sp.]